MLLVLATSAEARLTAPAIEAVGTSPPANAHVPLSLTLQLETGLASARTRSGTSSLSCV
jgi:hypothetical protein